MDPRYQVKQYVAVVTSEFSAFRVFRTGDDRFYLFAQIDPDGCETGLQIPVAKTALMDPVRRALAHGLGFNIVAYHRAKKLVAARSAL